MSLSSVHIKELLESSGITQGVVERRGYRSIETPGELEALGFSKVQASSAPGLLIPIHGIDGGVVLHQFKGSNPRNVDGKPVKYETPAGAKMRLDVHPAVLDDLLDPAVPLWITEGIKKVDALVSRGACPVGLLGVWNFSGTNEKGAITELPDWNAIPFKNKGGKARKVYIVFDSDIVDKAGVKMAAIKLATMLKRRGADAHMVRIPVDSEFKVGVDDYFTQHGGSVEGLVNSTDPSLLRLDMIRVDNRGLADMSEDAVAAMVRANDPPKVFVRGGELVAVQKDERDNVKILALDSDHVRSILSRATSFYRIGAKGNHIEVVCPTEIATDVRKQLGYPGVPPILAIAKAPVVSGDRIERSPGYCPGAAVYLDCPPIEDFDKGPEKAAKWLRDEIFGEFPFASHADFCHTLCLALLPMVRPAIDGPTPLHLFGAPTQGSGKTLLARVALMLTQGPSIAMTTMSGNEEETRKRITASLLEGSPYLFFDNLVGRISSASLSTILTNSVWVDRRLGASTNVQVEVRQALVATANNPDMDRDIVRRSIRIWIDAGVERPEMRGGFKPIERIIRTERPRILGALCAILDGWLKNGSPLYTGTALGSFEEWCHVMGGIMEVAGVPGFLANVTEMHQHDALEASWMEFYKRWSLEPGDKRVGDLMALFSADDDLSGLLGDNGDQSRKTKLASILRSRLGVVCADHVIQLAPRKDHGSALYRLVHKDERDTVLGRLFDIPAEARQIDDSVIL